MKIKLWKWKILIESPSQLLVLIGIVLTIGLLYSQLIILDAKQQKVTAVKIIPTIIPTATPTITPFPTAKHTPSPVKDPIVQCQLQECGTVSMTSSQCRLSGCCIVGNQKLVMTDQAKCNQMQKDYATNTTQNPGTSQLNSQTQKILDDAKNKGKYFEAQTCIQQAGYDADRCNQSCKEPADYGRNACNYAQEALEWPTERYTECLNENSDIYKNCLDSCTNTMTSKQNECLEKQKQ